MTEAKYTNEKVTKKVKKNTFNCQTKSDGPRSACNYRSNYRLPLDLPLCYDNVNNIKTW